MNELEEIQSRLKDTILNTCNKIGCDKCDLKWEDSCSALELQNKEKDLMFKKEDNFMNNFLYALYNISILLGLLFLSGLCFYLGSH